ncbi:HPF/RaiA family ribosome-associated protein [bacterium]|jgi:ribosome-associated translation inhibitor RaiA|nr:HPF/RaiA family ribosome-associated protein [bacterium]MBT4251071.1 HPF/RaiA family ribosome-associated protein [bacterium]MBT4597913.1 HPF/RaiA family ribosome-associated protein [bacterium]MBT6753895.1 HPF/RaiA family ribosome-associated protein [bacterium]MBT7037325.1 HPF/RaiA family ribosome-associated protein [bacterium]
MEIKYLSGASKLNESEKGYIEKKAQKTKKLLGEHEPNLLRAEFEIRQDKSGFWQIVMSAVIPGSKFRVEKKDKDMRKAIDSADEALLKKIRRSKEKKRDSLRRRKKASEVAADL